MVLLAWLRARVPEPARYEVIAPAAVPKDVVSPSFLRSLPKSFWMYSGFSAATMVGFTTCGVLSAALITGWAYDRTGGQVLGVLPVLAALVPVSHLPMRWRWSSRTRWSGARPSVFRNQPCELWWPISSNLHGVQRLTGYTPRAPLQLPAAR